MHLQVHNGDQAKVADRVIAAEFNESLVHQVVTAWLAGARAGTKAQKSRAQVRGGGSKPWRQKGTGRARAGTIRSPLWRTGGKTFAARPRDFAQKVNRKMYRGAMRAILSELVRQERLLAVSDFGVEEAKTRQLLAKLKELSIERALIVIHDADEKLYLAARNIPGVDVLEDNAINPVALVRAERVVMTVDALKHIEERLA